MTWNSQQTKKNPLSIDVFCDKPTTEPHLRWEKVELARENIILDKLLRPKPELAGFPPRVYIRKNYHQTLSAIRIGTQCPKRATKDELSKQIPKIHRSRNNVRR